MRPRPVARLTMRFLIAREPQPRAFFIYQFSCYLILERFINTHNLTYYRSYVSIKSMKHSPENPEKPTREELENLIDVSETVAREKLKDPNLSSEARESYQRSLAKIETLNKSGVRQRESKIKLPSYQGQDDTVLWGGIIQEAGRLYKEYALKDQNIPKDQEESLRARVKKLEHPEAFRSNVGLTVWSGELEKYGGMATYEALFGEGFTNMLESARTISEFSGYKLPPFRERRQTRLAFSQALLEAHRAFVKKARSLRGTEMTEAEREALEAAQAADKNATNFLWRTRDVEIYKAMVEDNLSRDVKGEEELRESTVVLGEEEKPKTEEERQEQIDALTLEKDRLWEEARQKYAIGEAREVLRAIIEVSDRIEGLRVAPLRSVAKEQVFAPNEEIEARISEFMDKIDTMTPEEFAAGLEEIKRFKPGKDTASIEGVLMSGAKTERERAEELPKNQSLKRLYGEKRALMREEMAAAIRGGGKRIDLNPEKVRERYETYGDYIGGKKAIPEDKREEIESAKRRMQMIEIDERTRKIKENLRKMKLAQREKRAKGAEDNR